MSSLSSLVSATESAVRLAEAAVTAAEEALAAARLARTEANTALTAARLALDLENRRTREATGTPSHQSLEREAREERESTEDSEINTDVRHVTRGGDYQEQEQEQEQEKKKKKKKSQEDQEERVEDESPTQQNSDGSSICENCNKSDCQDGKFLVKVLKTCKGLRVTGCHGPSQMVGKIGTVLGRVNGNAMICWDSDKKENVQIYSLQYQGQFAFKYYCQDTKPKVKEEPEIAENSEETKEVPISEKKAIDRKLFVGGLEKRVTDEYLKEYFEQFGKLTDWIVMKSPGTGSSLGFGFITFQESDMMKSCLESQPHYLNKKAVELRRATPPQPKSVNGESLNSSDKKLFIGGLDINVTDDYLMEYFEQFGKLTDWVVMKNSVTRMSLGYGFVTYQECHMVERCLEAQPHYLNGKMVGIGKVTPREGYQKEASVWVGGLNHSVTKEDLRNYFEQFGQLTSWEVMIGKFGKSKGFGFVTFKSPESTELCLKNQHHYLNGKAIDVKRFFNPKSNEPNTNPNVPLPLANLKDHPPSPVDVPSKWLVADRLPIKTGGKVWYHDADGEKHRIMFCASESLTLTGIGLLVRTTIKRLTVTLCHDLEHSAGQGVIFYQDFQSVQPSSAVLQLRHGIQLSCDRIYLLVLTIHGGASYVGAGGEEFVTVPCGADGGRSGGCGWVANGGSREVLFKFEDFRHRTDKPHQATDVEQGLVDRIYFEL